MEYGITYLRHLIGTYGNDALKLGRSSKKQYTLCVYCGREPDSGTHPVLHLNLDERTGLHDSGAHWRLQRNDREQKGHQWVDYRFHSESTPYPFEQWIIDQLAQQVRHFARTSLAEALRQLNYAPPKTELQWRTLQALFEDIERRLNLRLGLRETTRHDARKTTWASESEDIVQTTLALVRCAYELADVSRAHGLLSRFTNGFFTHTMTTRAITNPDCQLLIEPVVQHNQPFWCALMQGPMGVIARGEANQDEQSFSTRFCFFSWLVTLEVAALMEVWVNALLSTDTPDNALVRYAGHLNLDTMAHLAVRLLDRAIQNDDENPESLVVLCIALRRAGQSRRAAKIEAKCKRLSLM